MLYQSTSNQDVIVQKSETYHNGMATQCSRQMCVIPLAARGAKSASYERYGEPSFNIPVKAYCRQTAEEVMLTSMLEYLLKYPRTCPYCL